MVDEIGSREIRRDFRILYFSGTGNTEWIVKKVQEGLISLNHSVETMSADKLQADCGRAFGVAPDENLLREKIKEFLPVNCTLIIAFPTYASAIPAPIRDLLPLLPDGKGRKLAVMSTVHLAGGDCVHLPERMLRERGYIPVLATYVKMPMNMFIPNFEFFPMKNGEKLNSYYESAGKAVKAIVEELITEKAHFEGRGIADYFLGVTQRAGEKFCAHYLSKHMFAHAKCIRCALCASTCPMGNINFEKGYPEFGNQCCMCLRCYNFCPVHAIQITDKTLDDKKYPRYEGFDGWKPPILRKIEQVKNKGALECKGTDIT